MKTFGTLALLAAGAFLAVAFLGAGFLPTLVVLGLTAYFLIACSMVTGMLSLFVYMMAGASLKGSIFVLLPALPFWSALCLLFATGRFWLTVFAITQWEYFSPIEEDYWLDEANAEFYDAVEALSFRPWVYL